MIWGLSFKIQYLSHYLVLRSQFGSSWFLYVTSHVILIVNEFWFKNLTTTLSNNHLWLENFISKNIITKIFEKSQRYTDRYWWYFQKIILFCLISTYQESVFSKSYELKKGTVAIKLLISTFGHKWTVKVERPVIFHTSLCLKPSTILNRL